MYSKNIINLDIGKDGFLLESGERLPEIQIAYETFGELNQNKNNVIYVCHALTGDSHAADLTGSNPGWWDFYIGPGKAIDTDKYHVICSNVLGGCKGTTGSVSINPKTNKPYGYDFPIISIKDMVNVQKLLLSQLNIPSLYAVIGGSMGGMQAIQWGISYPDFVKKVIVIAASLYLFPQALGFDIIGRECILSDPNWLNGEYIHKIFKEAKIS